LNIAPLLPLQAGKTEQGGSHGKISVEREAWKKGIQYMVFMEIAMAF
jgi:hypothetical protein